MQQADYAERRGDRVSKTVSELDACVSAEGESRKRAHDVRDAGVAFRSPRRPGAKHNAPC